MLKLFKDLTRPPESLNSPGSGEPSSPLSVLGGRSRSSSYVTGNRSRSSSTAQTPVPGESGLANALSNLAVDEPESDEEEEEGDSNDPSAIQVVGLVHALQDVSGTMYYVETFSELLSVPRTAAARQGFRQNGGFDRLVQSLKALAWQPRPDDVDEEQWQVEEVQKAEAQRLCLEVLGWVTEDRAGARAFNESYGYHSLLEPLRRLSPRKDDQDVIPDARVLGLLLAHILGNNYALLSLFSGDLDELVDKEDALANRLSDVTLRAAAGLPLLWAYVWGLEGATGEDLWPDTLLSGQLEQNADGTTQGKLLRITLDILLLATRHNADLFLMRTNLPSLPDFLFTRIYGREEPRPVEVTFPARDEWYQNAGAEDSQPLSEWTAPTASLRSLYLKLLRNLLRAGVTPAHTRRLFTLVRSLRPEREKSEPEKLDMESSSSEEPTADDASSDRLRKASRMSPMRIALPDPSMPNESLNAEVLDMIRDLMPARTPASFVFRGGKGGAEGGLEIADLKHAWPSSTRGFIFTSWVYITHQSEAITLLHLSQKDAPHPLLQIRILENSQIALSSYADGQEGESQEVICGALEALVPHNEWVHIAIGCRKGRSASGGGGEARIFVNGKRVGAVRLPYPVPMPPKERSRPRHHHHNQHPQQHRQAALPSIRASVGRPWPARESQPSDASSGLGGAEDEWMLGRCLMLDEVISEELVMLMFLLGSHYHGNFQDALNKFLTYDASTSIHLYLYGLSRASQQKALSLLPSNSALVRAIRLGPAIPEENLMFSLCAKDLTDVDHVLNAAVPHSARASAFKNARARLVGSLVAHTSEDLDVSVASVGGGVVILKMIDLAQDASQLATALTILRDMIEHSWSASEEMERIYGFDLLAAILRPKMAYIVDVACAKILMSILGISTDEPETARVHNSAAYRAIGLDFELWSSAPLDVTNIYFDSFQALLSKSQHRRYNLLVTFQKSHIVRKLLFSIRSGHFSADALPMAVETLQLALVSRWSAEEAIKPVFAYLVSTLCDNTTTTDLAAEPLPQQLPGALILQMLADLLQNTKRLIKLTKALSLHRLLVVFIQSDPAPFVVIPCLDILATGLSTPGLESFQRSFENEGGFALLARALAPLWDAHIQDTIFRMIFGPTGPAGAALVCPAAIASLMTALDSLLQLASGTATAPTSAVSPLLSSGPLPPLVLDGSAGESETPDDRLENLLNQLAEVYRQSSAFRRALTARRIESMIPSLVDFAAMSTSSRNLQQAENQRAAAVNWLNALIDLSKAPPTVLTQMRLLVEQLKAAMSPDAVRSALPPASPLNRTAPLGSSTDRRPSLSMRRPSTDVQRKRLGMDRPVLRRVLSGESILQAEKDKNGAWRQIIIMTDTQRFNSTAVDRKEHWHRVSQVDWPTKVAAIRAENGVWADRNVKVTWRLDGSEGPLRMRNKLERIDAVGQDGPARGRGRPRDAIPSNDELSSAVSRVNNAPWEDPFALSLGESAPIDEEEAPSTQTTTSPEPTLNVEDTNEPASDDESYADQDEYSSNKMRLVSKTLQAGDVVEEAHNIVRIVGVDALPGLLILGTRNLYLIDGLVKTSDGKVVEADQAPRDVLSIPSGTLADLDPSDQRSHRWTYADVVESNKRAFLFRDVALELYFADKQNFLAVFRDKRARQAVVSKIQAKAESRDPLSRSIIGSLVLDTVARVTRGDLLEDMTRRWQSREISNFAYLQMLNQHAGRTPNDVTQYPVFPWVLSDYTSQILDLTNKNSYRDLSLPMGALTDARKEAAVERYQATEGVGETPFHYGTHYSSSMIVCGYMIRVSPFTEIFITLQGGSFDLADRLFSSIPRAWDSASSTNRGDVRELIPEFFYSPMFAVNMNHHDFGKKQVSGEAVEDVALPPWALDDPLLFVHWNREALESDYVSRHLPEWIDLTFGYKQRDPASFNCFHPLSYRGAVDLDKMKDEGEKAASTAIIHNFGQTPPQIFRTPHIQRYIGGRTSLPVGTRFGVAEHWQLLMRSAIPVTETNSRIHHILDPPAQDMKAPVQQKFRLAVPGQRNLSVQYGFADQSLRVYFQEHTHKLVHIIEGIDIGHAALISSSLLVTVSSLGVITVWRLGVKGNGARRADISLSREATLYGARNVTCIAVSAAWSILVTGSEDGTAMVWDINRMRYTRTLKTPRSDSVRLLTVNEANGHIALASDRHLYMFSLNGHPIAATSVDGGRIQLPELSPDSGSTPSKFTGGISFLKREFLRWGDLFVIGVGSQVALYRCVPGVRRFEDQEVEPWRLVKQGILPGSDNHEGGDCTAVRFVGETFYAGFEATPGTKHQLYQWTLPDGPARHVSDSITGCMTCNVRFGLLEPRRFCGGCGGVFCGTHALSVEGFNGRYCPVCLAQLAQGNSLGLMGSRSASRQGSRRGSIVLESAPVNALSGSQPSTPTPARTL